MHRLLLITSIAILCGVVPARAADSNDEPRRVAVGGFVSANLATVTYRPVPVNTESQQWNGGGATIDIALGGGISLDARAMWNRKGATFTNDPAGAFQTVSADYLSMPILVKVGTHGPLRVYAAAGPEFALRLTSRVVSTFGLSHFDENADAVTRRTDLAADFGGGVERRLGHAGLFVEGLYSYGLKNVVVPATPGERAKTRTFTLLAGVRF
jgi:hypothetical protein